MNTDPDHLRIDPIDPIQVEILRRMSPEERIRRGLEWNDFVFSFARTQIHRRHPDWSEDRVNRELVRRIHDITL